MFEIKRIKEKPVIIIRNVTPQELINYEKWKLEHTKKSSARNEVINGQAG